MVNAVYNYHLQVEQVLDSRLCTIKAKLILDSRTSHQLHQQDYLVAYKPFTLERWTLHICELKDVE